MGNYQWPLTLDASQDGERTSEKWPLGGGGGGGGEGLVTAQNIEFHCFTTHVTSISYSSETTKGRVVKIYIF